MGKASTARILPLVRPQRPCMYSRCPGWRCLLVLPAGAACCLLLLAPPPLLPPPLLPADAETPRQSLCCIHIN